MATSNVAYLFRFVSANQWLTPYSDESKTLMNGLVLTIHLVDGTSDGFQTAGTDGWIGKVIVAPKPELPRLLTEPELGGPGSGLGVYILIGEDPNKPEHKIIYIGQGAVANRLRLHSLNNDKAFWDNKTVVIVGQGGGLDPLHCLYLESRLINLAMKAGTAKVTNKVKPALPPMAPAQKTGVDNFLAQIQVLLPVLNIDYFVQPFVQPPVITPSLGGGLTPVTGRNISTPPDSPRFAFKMKGLTAEAEIINYKFVVLKGSLARPNEKPAIGRSNSALRSQLRASGKLVDDPSGKWTFAADVVFSSPSAAAAAVCGFNIAGPIAWKVKGSTQSYGEWLQAQVNAVPVMNTTP